MEAYPSYMGYDYELLFPIIQVQVHCETVGDKNICQREQWSHHAHKLMEITELWLEL